MVINALLTPEPLELPATSAPAIWWSSPVVVRRHR
jgi:hypothetical protein